MSDPVEKIKLPVDMEVDECCVCGVKFGIPKHWQAERRETHKGFWCPNGHTLAYGGESRQDIINKYKTALERISKIEIKLFSKSALELAVEIATNVLK